MMRFLQSLLFFVILHPVVLADEDQQAEQIRVQEILNRALEKADYYAKQKIENQFQFNIREVSTKLDGEGKIEEKEKTLYRSRPIQGHHYRRLVEKQNRQLTPEEEEEEKKKEEKFIKRIEEGKEPEEEENRVTFDRNLTNRYDFWLKEEKLDDNGRKLVVLAFRPKDEKLPVDKRIDRALNESVGEMWIDEESSELVRVEFGIFKKIKLWWGIIGSLYELNGSVTRQEIEPGIWMNDRFEMYIHGRIFFSKFRRKIELTWEDYTRIRDLDSDEHISFNDSPSGKSGEAVIRFQFGNE